MNMQYYLEFSDLPEQLERKDIYNIFKPFGYINKLYIHPSNGTGRISLETKQRVEEAYAALNGAPPYYLKLSTTFNCSSNNSFQDDASSQNNGTMNYYDNDNDVMTDIGPVLVNINGIQVNTLKADDGEIYVPLIEVKELGFELFDPDCLPRRLDFDVQLIKEFEMYLTMKARKFMIRRSCKLSDGIVDSAVEKMKHQVFNIKVTTKNNSRNSSFVQSEHTVNDTRPYNQYNAKQFVNKKLEALAIDIKPLRKPYANKDADLRKFDGNRERLSTNNYERRGTSMGHNSFSSAENKGQSGMRNQNKFENNGAARNASTNLVLPKKDINASPKLEKEINASPKLKSDSARTVDTTIDVNESHVKAKDVEQSTVFRKAEPTYDQIDLNLNTELEVEITHVDSKNKYWVCRKDQKDIMHEILVQTNYNTNEASAGHPVIGKICAADFFNVWYRVIILNIQPTLKVLYIDFGNKNTEQIKEIRDLPASLRSIPGQAVCITFDNLPSTTLEVGTEMKITPNKKLSDGTYVVTEAVQRKVSLVLNELNAKPSGIQFIVGNVDPPKDEKEIVSNSVNHSTGAIPKTTVFNNDKQKVNSPTPVLEAKKIRQSVIESVGSEGQIQCMEIIDDSTFLAFILPTANIDELVVLEEIGTNAKADKNFTANIGDLIAVYYEKEGCWVRGLVTNIQNGKYTTALVDYAVVTQPIEICDLNKKLIDIPEFSCLCTCKPEVMDLVKKFKGVEIPCNIIEASKLKLQFHNGATCIVHCEKWNPLATSKQKKTPSPSLSLKPLQSSMKIKPVFTDPPRVKILKQGDVVIIVSNTNQKLLVRTKECNTLHKSIVEEISKLESQPLKVPPIVNQIVLSAHESSTVLYRCIIKSIDNNIAEVDFIDYGFQDSVPVSNLREISESLATKDLTLIPITLKSFENEEFSAAALKQLEDCSSKVKFNAEAISEPDVFDLLNAKKESLSDQLLGRSRSSTPGTRVPSRSLIITYQKLTEPNLSLGSHQLLYINTEALNKGKMVFMITDEKITQRFLSLSDEINGYVATDNTPYFPRTNEICLALFEDGWFRAQVSEANETSDLFDVYFIDFGNSHRTSSKNIRKMPVEFAMTPPVAVNCIFKDLMTKEVKGQLFSRLQDLLGINKPHAVEIIDITDKTYTITIPSIVQTLKAERLL